MDLIKKWSIFFLVWCGFLFTQASQALSNDTQVLGVSIPYDLTLAATNEKLHLNGHAIASLWGMQAFYVGALYTTQLEKRAEMLLINDNPMAMVFYFVHDDISPEMIKKMFTEGILINNEGWGNKKSDKDRILELQEAFKQNLNAGDVLVIQYSPVNGVLMILNGKVLNNWPHAKAFYNVLLRIWVGPYPPTRGFKQAILNFPASRSY